MKDGYFPTISNMLSDFAAMSGIHMFLGLKDPHPDPLVRDTDPDPSIIKQKK